MSTKQDLHKDFEKIRDWLAENAEDPPSLDFRDKLPPIRGQNLVLPLVGTLKKSDEVRKPENSDKRRQELALKAKEVGNQHFKQGDYKNALKYYSESIGHESTVVGLINRALVHLKLNNWKEAEKDCTNALQQDDKNVKALYRRGMARQELNNYQGALQDLRQALKLEPTNQSVKDDLAKLEDKMDDVKSSGKLLEKKPVEKPVEKKQSIESLLASLQDDEPLPTINLKPPSKPFSIHVIQDLPVEEPHVPTEKAKPIPSYTPSLPKPPKSKLEFDRDLMTVYGTELAVPYWKSVDCKSYTQLFSQGLESDQFPKILDIMMKQFESDGDVFLLSEMLENLIKVPRMDIMLLFLDGDSRQTLNKLLKHVDSRLASKYQ